MSWPPPLSAHASAVRPCNWSADSPWIVPYASRLPPGGGLVVGGVVVGGAVVGGVVVGGVVVGGAVVGGAVVGGPVVGGWVVGPPVACGELAALAPPDHTAT